jgi:sulfatase modifying factor 1
MEFVLIPAGSFIMGSPPDEPYRDESELAHGVTISKPFYMQTTEVTVAQWRAVMGSRWFDFFRLGREGGNLPVTKVCRWDAEEFLERLNAMHQGSYRLPTEAEWEYAARAGTSSAYSWGDRIDCDRAMYGNSGHNEEVCREYARSHGLPLDGPAPVKSYAPNAWGLYDMSGNVWEWVQDRYGDYAPGPQIDPQGPQTGETFVRRGGSWFSSGAALRSANRAYSNAASRLATTGFRVVRIAESR